MKNQATKLTKFVLFSALAILSTVPTAVYAQTAAQRATEIQRRADQAEARIKKLEAAVDFLSTSVTTLSAGAKSTEDKVGESGWKALDATTKLFTLQISISAFVVALVLAVTFGGGAGYKMLREKLEGEIKESMHKQENEIKESMRKQENEIKESMRNQESILRHSTGGLAFGQLCMGFWRQYEASKGATAEEQRRTLDTLLLLSEYALEYADNLERLANEEYEDLITNIRANHAYWLAAQPDPQDPTKPNPKNSERAIKLAKQAFAVGSKYMKAAGMKYIHRWPDWMESYCWVITRFDETQKASAKELIAAICADARVDEAWKGPIRDEYFGGSPKTKPASEGPAA